MQWCEAIVHTTTEGSDIVSEALMLLGAVGTEIVDRADVPDPSKPGVYWELYDPKMLDEMPEDVLVKAWFEQNEHIYTLLESVRLRLEELSLADFGLPMGKLSLDIQNVADEDWS
ncbi:MAG: 50S ribosomal protein L11 methyltransferase, partial [Clostridia bacterium]